MTGVSEIGLDGLVVGLQAEVARGINLLKVPVDNPSNLQIIQAARTRAKHLMDMLVDQDMLSRVVAQLGDMVGTDEQDAIDLEEWKDGTREMVWELDIALSAVWAGRGSPSLYVVTQYTGRQ